MSEDKKKGRKLLPPHLQRTPWNRRIRNEVIAIIKKSARALGISDTAYVESLVYKDNDKGES